MLFDQFALYVWVYIIFRYIFRKRSQIVTLSLDSGSKNHVCSLENGFYNLFIFIMKVELKEGNKDGNQMGLHCLTRLEGESTHAFISSNCLYLRVLNFDPNSLCSCHKFCSLLSFFFFVNNMHNYVLYNMTKIRACYKALQAEMFVLLSLLICAVKASLHVPNKEGCYNAAILLSNLQERTHFCVNTFYV